MKNHINKGKIYERKRAFLSLADEEPINLNELIIENLCRILINVLLIIEDQAILGVTQYPRYLYSLNHFIFVSAREIYNL
jgi:hypothetical protein